MIVLSCGYVMLKKKHSEWIEMGGHKQSLGGDGAPGPTVATALATSTKNDTPVASFVNSR